MLPWMRHPVEVYSFQELPLELVPCLDPQLESALKCICVKALFPVQVAVWQETVGPGAAEHDLCVCSLAYALPIVQILSRRTLQYLRALVVLCGFGLHEKLGFMMWISGGEDQPTVGLQKVEYSLYFW